jgi:hypothetical protein
MQLANVLFYLSFGVVILLMFIGIQNRSDNVIRSKYWPISIGLLALASFSFVCAGFTPIIFLSIANISLAFSGFAIVIFIRSWDESNKKVRPEYFWGAFFVSLIGYELLRVYASFGLRVYLMTAIVGGISLLGLIEAILASSEGKRLQFNVLKMAFALRK